MHSAISLFSNRELAVGYLAIALFVAGLFSKAFRRHYKDLLQAAFRWKLLAAVAGMAVWLVGVVAVLRHFGLWNSYLLKDTILWFLFSGIALGFSGMLSSDGLNWRRSVRDNVSAVIILEFVANLRSFPLAVEIGFVPIVALVVAADTYAKESGRSEGRKATRSVLAIIGIALLAYTATHLAQNWESVRIGQLWRELLLPPVLSAVFLPCVYIVGLVAVYERLFTQLDIWSSGNSPALRYAKFRLVAKLGPRLERVREFLNDTGTAIPNFESREEVDKWLNENLGDAGQSAG